MSSSVRETLCLRRDTYEHEFDRRFPGIVNRIGICLPISREGGMFGNQEGWKERGDPSGWRREDVWYELKRREPDA